MIWGLTLDTDTDIIDIFKVDIFKINWRPFVELQGAFLICDSDIFVIHAKGSVT